MFILTLVAEQWNIQYARLRGIKEIAWNYFNRLRILLVLLLFLLKSTEFISYIYSILFSGSPLSANNDSLTHVQDSHLSSLEAIRNSVQDSHKTLVISSFIAPAIQSICYLALIIIYYQQRRAGLHTSKPVWFYLFISICCDLLEFYSVIFSVREEIFNHIELIVKYTHYPILVLLFIFECRGDTPSIEPDLNDVRPDSPETQASFFSQVTFWWYNNFLIFGYRCRLKLSNLWKTLPRDKAGELVPIFRWKWARSAGKLKKQTYNLASGETQPMNNMLCVLAKLFWSRLMFAAILKLIQDSIQYITPLILKRLLAFMKSKDAPYWHGALFAMLLLLVPTVQSVILGNYFFKMQLIGLQVRTMIIGAVYRKALLLGGSSRVQSTSGEIVNLMAVDSHRFQDLSMYVNLLWSAPYQILLAIVLLHRELGWPVFAGVVCMALFLPCNAYLANRIKMAQIKVMKTKDERIKQMNEVLGGIKVIKLYAWENSFISNLIGFRSRELSSLNRIMNLEALSTFLWQCSPFVVACVTFAVYVTVDSANILDAEKAFVSIALFHLLRFPLTMLPSLVTSMVLAVVSSKRLNKFLNNNELVRYVTRNEELEAISIEGGSVAWSAGETGTGRFESVFSDRKAILRDIDLHVKPKSFVAIVGQVASGKSSLLSAILGEMHHLSGRFNVCKSMSMAYVPQQAWIQNMTVKENILFGSQLDEDRYNQILSACSLHSDLETLPGGDGAEIGEKGINLSGGQKQRVSLARACYSNSDIYLLDDPLSALDSHVAKHVFDKVLSSTTGLLRNKTRVLATNNLFVLPHVDQVIVLDDGRVVEAGTYKDLMANSKGHLAEIMSQYSMTQEDRPEVEDEEATVDVTSPQSVEMVFDDKALKSAGQKADLGKLIEVEKIEMGSVNYRVYLKYFKAVSLAWLTTVVVSLTLASAFNVATNLWLSIWASDAEDPKRANDTELRTTRLVVYAAFGGLQCFTVLVGSLALGQGAVRAARMLHSSLLERVMHSPMGFFDTTPIGRIVNRFAKDIDVIDMTLPGGFRSWFNCLLQVISTLFVICYSFPTFLIIIIPLAIIYCLIQKIFIVTTRQLKRLESTTRSPIYSNFGETLSGISTIRAYDCVDRFVRYSDMLIDRNQSCSYPNIIANRWLSIRLEFFGNLITASAALFSVYYKGLIGAEVAGLTISYSLNITQTLSWFVRMTSDLETHIVSVERILEYMRGAQEDKWIKGNHRPPPEWPGKGSISIENYSTRYRNDTDLVLRDLSISIRPEEKIGIVGRTGSGKSSLSLALFRILEPVSGSIAIDELDLAHFGLHDIRSRLTIIPQDPVLFSGTIRFNLDPLKLYKDEEIWHSLKLAHLKGYISTLRLGLDHRVSEYGENFSVGQRQLICLARAILRKSKILILDEATASVDVETDSIVQRTIREIFSDCTIITIAHRLHTILDSDRILVLESGRVRELDSPVNLIANPSSAFASLVRDAGLDASSILRQRRRRDLGATPSEL